MKISRVIRFAVVALALSVPAEASAQNPPDSVDAALVMEREVFEYPEYARRNPFAPLLSAEGGGPRFERLVLLGIMFSSDPASSIALFGEGAPATAEAGMTLIAGTRTYRLRVGDKIGNTTVLDIQNRSVRVAVDQFGQSEQHTMELRRRTVGQGGPP